LQSAPYDPFEANAIRKWADYYTNRRTIILAVDAAFVRAVSKCYRARGRMAGSPSDNNMLDCGPRPRQRQQRKSTPVAEKKRFGRPVSRQSTGSLPRWRRLAKLPEHLAQFCNIKCSGPGMLNFLMLHYRLSGNGKLTFGHIAY